MKTGVRKQKTLLAAVLALCMLLSVMQAVPAFAAETELMNFGTSIQYINGTPNEGYIQMQSAGTGTPRVFLNTWTTAGGNTNDGRSEYAITEDKSAFTLKQTYFQKYGDNVKLRTLADTATPLNMDEPMMFTIRFKTELADNTQPVSARIRMRLMLQLDSGEREFDLDSKLMPVTKDNSGYQIMQFYFDPAKGEYCSYLNGETDQVKVVKDVTATLNNAMFYLLGYPGENPETDRAPLPTALTWTIDEISVSKGAVKPSSETGEKTLKLDVDNRLAIENKVTLKDQDTGNFVDFKGWTAGELSPAADSGQVIWKTVKESINEDHISIPGNSTGAWVSDGIWKLSDDTKLLLETRVKVQPVETDQGVRARFNICARDQANKEITNYGVMTSYFSMDGEYHVIRLRIDKGANKAELYEDGKLVKSLGILGDLSGGIQQLRIYTACDNGGTVAGSTAADRVALTTPINFTFDYFKVYEEGGSGGGEEVIEPERPDPVEKPIPESLKDSVVRTYPNGLMKAAVMSYDDATNWNYNDDKTMLDILNRYGVRCTLNAITAQLPDSVAQQYVALGAGTVHELASHSTEHAKIEDINLKPNKNVYMTNEAVASRALLERYAGAGNVRGWVTPYGYDLKANGFYGIIRNAGYDYIRGINNTSETNRFRVPANFLNWESTMAFEGTDDQYTALTKYMDDFSGLDPGNEFKLFFIWGHSHGFGKNVNGSGQNRPDEAKTIAWSRMEEWAKYLQSNKDTIWNPTCLEYVDYVDAARQLDITDEGGGAVKIVNPSDTIACFVKVDDKLVEVKAGETFTTQASETSNFEYLPGAYHFSLDQNIQSGTGGYSEIGTVTGFAKNNQMKVYQDSVEFIQNTHSYFSDSLILEKPAETFDPAKPTVLKLRYRVAAADYGVELPNVRLAFTNTMITAESGVTFATNNNDTPNTQELTLSKASENTWRTVEFKIDPASKKVYVSNDGGAEAAYGFTTDLTEAIMNNFRIYPAVRPQGKKVYEAESDPPEELTTAITWTIDSIEMYQMEANEFLRISRMSQKRTENVLECTATFTNFGVAPQNAVAAAALYERGTGVMKAVQTADLSVVEAGKAITVNLNFDGVEAGKNYDVKAFVWDSFAGMAPYDCQTIPVSN